MSDATVTVVGRLTAKPTYGHTKNQDVFANFDVAVNHGYYDRERQMYIETGASFFSVSTFRNLAINAIESLDRGTPVIVQGRLRLVKWESNDKQGMTARIEANSVGPDLNWGQADYTNIKRPRLDGDDPMDDPNVLGAVPTDPEGLDSEASEHSEAPDDVEAPEDVEESEERVPAVLSA